MEKYTINKLTFKKTISEEKINEKIAEIAKKINEDYKNSQPCFLITMKGAIFFAVEILKQIEIPCTIDIISAKSYGEKMKSNPGEVSIQHNNLDLKGKDVILVEDIVDTGYTLEKLLKTLNFFSPKSVKVATLLAKPDKFCVDVHIDYLGFSMSPEFIIGFGLDFNEFGRNLKSIYTLEN
jgi:hypoxanthine phosphoribosyltransferase